MVATVRKESPETISRPPPQLCGSLWGSLYSGFVLWGLQGNLWGSTTGNLIVTENGRGASRPCILADQVPTCLAQLVPSSIFAHLQNQISGSLTSGTWHGSGLTNSGPQMSCFASPEAQTAELSQSHRLQNMTSSPSRSKSLLGKFWELPQTGPPSPTQAGELSHSSTCCGAWPRPI